MTEFINTPADFLGWAVRSGWKPSRLPVGVIFTFQTPVTRALEAMTDRFEDNTELTVSNARMLMTTDEGAPVLVSCLNPGGASMATQLEHLQFLGADPLYAAIVGTAGGLETGMAIAETLAVESAVRTDGISDHYLDPAPTVDGDPEFVAALHAAVDTSRPPVRTWTVPVPYRSTQGDLQAALDLEAAVVEMEIATLFAVGQSLGIPTAAAVVISDVNRVDGWEVDWSDTTPPTVDAVLAAIDVIRSLAG